MIIIERFEGALAVLEDSGRLREIEKALLPLNAKEGDVLELQDGEYIINNEKTAERRRSIINKLRGLGL